jgi:hypothetical protein
MTTSVDPVLALAKIKAGLSGFTAPFSLTSKGYGWSEPQDGGNSNLKEVVNNLLRVTKGCARSRKKIGLSRLGLGLLLSSDLE